MNREIRQLAVLALLRHQRSGLDAEEIRACLGDAYAADGESAQRRFREDLQDLRRARLIQFTSLRPGQRVHRVPLEKDPTLRFSPAEHAALQRARTRVGPVRPADPIPADPGTDKLAKLLRVIRCVEELGSGRVAEIADRTGMRPGKVAELVERLRTGRGITESLRDLEVEPRDERARAHSEFDLPPGPERDHPLGGRGMDEFGLFAYSGDEVEECLDLIARALADSDRDAPQLESARQKLLGWREKLRALSDGAEVNGRA